MAARPFGYRATPMVEEADEMIAPGGLAWDEQRAVPLLADFECSACGQLLAHLPGCPEREKE